MARLRVQVVDALPGRFRAVSVSLPAGATVRDALAAAGFDAHRARVGIFGELAAADQRLADGDRVEVYRALKMDAKEARRRRAKR